MPIGSRLTDIQIIAQVSQLLAHNLANVGSSGHRHNLHETTQLRASVASAPRFYDRASTTDKRSVRLSVRPPDVSTTKVTSQLPTSVAVSIALM